MSRSQTLLVALIGVELIVGGFLVYPKINRSLPPVPDFSKTDETTARDISELVAKCKTVDDWRALAYTYLAGGYFAHAEACYRHAATLAPNNPDIRYDWGFCLIRVGNLAESNKQFHLAVELGHKIPTWCWYFVGRNHLRAGNPDEARAMFVRCPDLPAAQFELARLHLRASKYTDKQELAKSATLLQKVLRTHPDAVQPNILYHRVLAALGKKDKALRFLDNAEFAFALMQTPYDRMYDKVADRNEQLGYIRLYKAADKALEASDFDKAETLYRKALQLKRAPAVMHKLGIIALQRNQPKEAVRLYREWIANHGPSTYHLNNLGRALAESGEWHEARWALLQAAQMRTQEFSIIVYRNLSTVDKHFGSKNIHRWDGLHHHYEGTKAFWAADWANAQRRFETAVGLDNQHDHTWYYLGETHRLQGNSVKARQAYQRCLQINPGHGRAYASLQRVMKK